MYVCLCKGITDSDIREAVDGGASSIKDLRKQLGVSSQCGKCACMAKDIVRDYQSQLAQFDTPIWAVA